MDFEARQEERSRRSKKQGMMPAGDGFRSEARSRRSKKPRQSGAGLAALAVGLSKRLAVANVDGNLVFSPLSIYAVLALVATGARGNTLDEVLGVLGAQSRQELAEFVGSLAEHALADRSASGGPRVAFACGVWADATRPLKPAYRRAVVGKYKAEAETVDFRNKAEEARNKINAWAAHVTRNLIGSVLPPGSVKSHTGIVLGNAIYFKGKWDQPFDKRATMNKSFYRLGGRVVNVPFMPCRKDQFIAVHDGFKVLKLRYKMQEDHTTQAHPFGLVYPSSYVGASNRNNLTQYAMCIFLPDANDGLWSLVDEITSHPGFLHARLPERRVAVGEFRVPKFKLSFSSSVTVVLKELGLRLPFSDEADLSDMTEDDGSIFPTAVEQDSIPKGKWNPAVENIFHKAVVEVNEEGTEAAAVTMTVMAPTCARMPPPPPPRVDFVADHPFAYFIVEEMSGAIVFAGHVLDPSRE